MVFSPKFAICYFLTRNRNFGHQNVPVLQLPAYLLRLRVLHNRINGDFSDLHYSYCNIAFRIIIKNQEN